MDYIQHYESGAYLDWEETPTYYKEDADEMLREGILTGAEYQRAILV